MGMTTEQTIPEKKKVAVEPWSFRRLITIPSIVNTFAKVFVKPLDVILVLLVLAACLDELFLDGISWMFFVLIVLVLIFSLFDRLDIIDEVKIPKKEHGKK